MKRVNVALVIAGILLFTPTNISSQETGPSDSQNSNYKPESTVSTDMIFDEIMTALPKEVRVRVDSASQLVVSEKDRIAATDSQKKAGLEGDVSERQEQMKNAVAELPEEIRNRVEKAIQDIEKRNEERKIEIKEFGRKQ